MTNVTIYRNGLNRPTTVTATAEAMTYTFEIAPELNDSRIQSLVESLIDFEIRGDQVKRNRRR